MKQGLSSPAREPSGGIASTFPNGVMQITANRLSFASIAVVMINGR